MLFKPIIEVRDKYVLVTHAESEAGNREPTQFAGELAEACDQAGIHRVLLDERKLTYTVGNIFDLMGIGDKLLEDMLVFRFHRLACVPKPDQLDTARDFESVARNRGMNFRAFESMAAAEAWLTEE